MDEKTRKLMAIPIQKMTETIMRQEKEEEEDSPVGKMH